MWDFIFYFRKFALILLVAAFGSIHTQNSIQIECDFTFNIFDDYTCLLEGIEVLDESSEIEIIGEHVDGMSDANVVTLDIRNSNTPFMIQQFFSQFPNLYEVDIEDSNLQSINVPETVQLMWFIVYGNNITRFETGSIRGQQRIQYLELANNQIEAIDEGAFLELGSLRTLVMHSNQISQIVGATFHPLNTLLYIDLDRNNLVRLQNRLFADYQEVYTLYMQYNQINEIHRDWVLELEHTLRSVDLRDNSCVDRTFSLINPEGWIEMHETLQNCYDNFNATADTRRITMEFTGPMVIFDEFGNVIARI